MLYVSWMLVCMFMVGVWLLMWKVEMRRRFKMMLMLNLVLLMINGILGLFRVCVVDVIVVLRVELRVEKVLIWMYVRLVFWILIGMKFLVKVEVLLRRVRFMIRLRIVWKRMRVCESESWVVREWEDLFLMMIFEVC